LKLTINLSPANPSLISPFVIINVPATGVMYSCSVVTNANTYLWSYSGTGATITSGQGTNSILVDYAANTTSGQMRVVAISAASCSSAVVSANILLPIKLDKFTVSQKNNSGILNWVSKLEANSKSYEIERSVDGIVFIKIATINARGSFYSYTFIDDILPRSNRVYYRLRLVDKDETFSYSEIRNLKLNSLITDLLVYPNPIINGKLNIDFGEELNVKTKYIITTVDGRTVQYGFINSQYETIDLQNLANGMYVIKLASKQKQFIKQ
jgi:hypothetical protein